VHFVSMVKTNRLEGDSSGVGSKNSCSIWYALVGITYI
jgi:hypothetical protein